MTATDFYLPINFYLSLAKRMAPYMTPYFDIHEEDIEKFRQNLPKDLEINVTSGTISAEKHLAAKIQFLEADFDKFVKGLQKAPEFKLDFNLSLN